jgi:hypothetical protein
VCSYSAKYTEGSRQSERLEGEVRNLILALVNLNNWVYPVCIVRWAERYMVSGR